MSSKFPPGPKDHLFGITLAHRFRSRPLEFLDGLRGYHPDLTYFRMGPVRLFQLFNPELIHQVLVTQAKKYRKVKRLTRVFVPVDGQGLIVTEGDFWQRQRRLVQKAFQPRRMDGYARLMVECARQTLAGWRAGMRFNAADTMTELTAAIIAKTMFSEDLGPRAAESRAALRVLGEVLTREFSEVVRLPDWLPTPEKRRKRRAIATQDAIIRDFIRRRRASGEDKGDLLSTLLLAVDEEGNGSGMTDEQVRDEVMTIFNAGHDTTAAALTWVWYVLATHPEVEARVLDEVDHVLAGCPATFEDVHQLVYTRMVIQETMRLYPPTWAIFARTPVEDTTLAGYDVPKGSWVYASQYVTHRDERYFPDPLRFEPERFSPKREAELVSHSYFPFGAGPHVCIGQSFALLEITLLVATVLQQFRVELAEPNRKVTLEPLVALRPAGGLPVVLRERGGDGGFGQGFAR